MGGGIFVMDGGSLTLQGAIALAGNTVAAGNGGGLDAGNGSAFGGGLFLNGNGIIRFNPGSGRIEHVFDAIDDQAGLEANGYTPPDGFTPGSYRLVKSGLGTLVLRADNAYSGGTTLKAGTVDLTGLGAAGTGAIKFKGTATLEIANAAFSGGVFGNPIDAFGNQDTLDLRGLHFHAAAKATYHIATHDLTVESGGVTDTLTLFFPAGTHFKAANDGHGGIKVTLDPPAPSVHAVASLSPHDLTAHDWASDASHHSDFLLVA
jgi:autotransporter-associated beta strand protein